VGGEEEEDAETDDAFFVLIVVYMYDVVYVGWCDGVLGHRVTTMYVLYVCGCGCGSRWRDLV
jgi:hypothetical protein